MGAVASITDASMIYLSIGTFFALLQKQVRFPLPKKKVYLQIVK